jgi:hypothetical protein
MDNFLLFGAEKGADIIYPYKKRTGTKIINRVRSVLSKLASNFAMPSFRLFSPVNLFMKGWINSEEYRNISKHNVVKLRLYHPSNTTLFIKVVCRITLKTTLKILGKIF